MRELEFMSKLGDGTHPLPKATKQKEKKGSWLLSKVDYGTHRNEKKLKIKIRCLPLNSCFQTFCSSSSKLSTLQALSSLNPNA
jgi:hypothetical protein